MTNLDKHIKNLRHYFINKILSSQGYGLPVVMYGCKSWTIKKAEYRRIDAFKLRYWRRLLRVTWTAKRSNKPILNKISPELFIGRTDAEAEAPAFGYLMLSIYSFEKTLSLAKIEAKRS